MVSTDHHRGEVWQTVVKDEWIYFEQWKFLISRKIECVATRPPGIIDADHIKEVNRSAVSLRKIEEIFKNCVRAPGTLTFLTDPRTIWDHVPTGAWIWLIARRHYYTEI